MTLTLTDYITGKKIFDTGSEANRQVIEKFLVDKKGYAKSDIRVDEPIEVTFKGEPYTSTLDLVVFFRDRAVMAVRCAAGSIGSYEREIVSGARLVYDYQIPLAVTADGRDAIILDTLSGKKISQGMDTLPSKEDMACRFDQFEFSGLDTKRKEREMIIFRSFNMDRTNR